MKNNDILIHHEMFQFIAHHEDESNNLDNNQLHECACGISQVLINKVSESDPAH